MVADVVVELVELMAVLTRDGVEVVVILVVSVVLVVSAAVVVVSVVIVEAGCWLVGVTIFLRPASFSLETSVILPLGNLNSC